MVHVIPVSGLWRSSPGFSRTVASPFFSIVSKQKCKTGTGTDAYLLTINACLAVFLSVAHCYRTFYSLILPLFAAM
jgi:hypothetical protein